ncbi:hypothetical protein [Bradyrhizobium oligotrophicum]|uniref:hypothetical protein n=1 Tax=Bradyrhizobium oligotrophicum TaxID=44255 RepID=UPI003EBA1FA6
MADITVAETIDKLSAEITAAEAAIRKKKETVNTLCTILDRPPAYQIEDAVAAVPTSIRSDQFYGQPLASAVRTILEMRKQRGLGAATNNEIYDALTAGGYEFDTRSEDIARKSLRNSLAKNTALFHKLPNGQFGLLSWYPNVRKSRVVDRILGDDAAQEQDVESGDTNVVEPKAAQHADQIVADDNRPLLIGGGGFPRRF